MSSLEIAAKYKSNTAEGWKRLFLWFLPLWAVLAPIGMVIAVIWSLGERGAVIGLSFAAGLLLLTLGSAWATIMFSDNRIIISRRGLRVPPFLTLFATGRSEIPWTSIGKVTVLEDEHYSALAAFSDVRKKMLFKLKDRDEIQLRLQNLTREEIEQVVMALNLWLEDGARDISLESLRTGIAINAEEKKELTYTQLWEAELESRYTATAFMPLEPGQTLLSGSLKILRQLSFGGLSAVYLCQENNRELRVLKESVVPGNTKEALRNKAKELFHREAEILVKLDHPQIVKVLSFFSEADRTYLLLSWEEGTNLRQLVREKGPLDEGQVKAVAQSLTAPLAYLHNLDVPVVHRDVSPENIILRDDGVASLIDFGAANEFLGTATGTLVGKHCYISPEQFKGKARCQSDLYSLGGTLYFLLTGEDPIPLTSSSPKALRPEISEAMNDIVTRLTAMELSERIASVEELGQLLSQI